MGRKGREERRDDTHYKALSRVEGEGEMHKEVNCKVIRMVWGGLGEGVGNLLNVGD
jgi:hypothetical protein